MPETKPKSSLAARLGRPLLAGAAATAAVAAPHSALADIFLQLDGIKGESMDDKFKDAIDLLSYTQSFRTPTSISAAGLAAGKVQCGAVTVLKNIDKASPLLIQYITTGKHIAKGVLSFRTSSEQPIVYYTVTLNDLVVSSIDQTDNPDAGKIVEKLTLVAGKFEFQYKPQNPDGSLGAPVDFGFNCKTNTKF
jgi:type VI secretion system secreted protein Hcp